MVAPLVDLRHIDIVDKDGHVLALRRGEVFAHLEVALDFHVVLEGEGFGGRGEVHTFEKHHVAVKAFRVHKDRGGLSGT